MKITDIKITAFSLGQLKKPYWNSIITTTKHDFSRVEVYTDTGAIGMALGASQDALHGQIKDAVVGEDPLRTEYLWDKMYMGGWRKPIAKGEHIRAMSVIDNALWDLKGKILNEPTWRLLGGARDKIPAYAAGGYYEKGKGLRELCSEMELFVNRGYRGVKMKVGWPGITTREDVERVKAVRDTVGPDIDLMIDANNAWDAVTAIKFGRLIEQYDPYWFEEPVHADDLRGGARVVMALNIPVASGENEFTRWGFRDLIDSQAADIIQADPNICGGISEWIKVAAMASSKHLKMAPHGDAHVGSVCVGAVHNSLTTETYPTLQAYLDEFLEPVDFRDGYIHLSERPGLGLEWNESSIQHHAAQS